MLTARPPPTSLLVLIVTALVLPGCLGLASENDSGRQKVVLAIQPTDNAAKIQDKATELEAFLEARTSLDIEIVIPLTNSGVVEALRFKHADVAMLSAWPSYLANKISGAEIVLAEKREVVIGTEAQVQPYYFSYYVVQKNSPIQTLADLRDKDVAFPSATSTSGYVFPLARLVTDGLIAKPASGAADPHPFFGDVLFAGGYGQGWAALKSGQVDATVIAGDVNAQLYHEVLNNTRVIATQGPVPSHGVVFASHFQGPARDELLQAFLELKGEHQALMRSLVSAIFVEFTPTTTDEHTASLRTALDAVGLKFEEKLG